MFTGRAKTVQDPNELERKYSCSSRNAGNELDVLVQLKSPTKRHRHLPMRYSLVIDISASMEQTFGTDPMPLLDRVKLFCTTLVEKVRSNDSVAIIAFDDEADTVFPMKIMNSHNKKELEKTLKTLKPRGQTNLSAGLIGGLNACGRDCIIVFTDGDANHGIVDGDKLVDTFRNRSKKLGRQSSVPVSAFTIGGYQPILLLEICERLGSDAFYWLNDASDFEADMFLPLFLRQITHITDIDMKFKCIHGVTMIPDNIESQTKFIHVLPENIFKEFLIKLKIPKGKKLVVTNHSQVFPLLKGIRLPCNAVLTVPWSARFLNGRSILSATFTYFDHSMEKITVKDSVQLELKTIYECRRNESFISDDISSDKIDFMKSVIAYEMINNASNITLEGAKNSYINLSKFKCNKKFSKALKKVNQNIRFNKKESESVESVFDGAKRSIEKIYEKVSYLAEKEEKSILFVGFENFITDITQEQQQALEICQLADHDEDRTFPRIASMNSSVQSCMPTACGVFNSDKRQRNTTRDLFRKVEMIRKIIRRRKRVITNDQLRVFQACYFVLSEELRNKTFGKSKEKLNELIIKCNGTPVPNVKTMFNNTVLICSQHDYGRGSPSVRDALNCGAPIVSEDFLVDSIKAKKMIAIDRYILENMPIS